MRGRITRSCFGLLALPLFVAFLGIPFLAPAPAAELGTLADPDIRETILMFKGTASLKPGAIDRLVRLAAGRHNAFTSLDYTAYHITLPTEHLETALRIEADRMVNAAMDPQELVREKTVHLPGKVEAIIMLGGNGITLDNPDYYVAFLDPNTPARPPQASGITSCCHT